MKKALCFIFVSGLLCACGTSEKRQQTTASKSFKMVEVPTVLENPEDRASFVAKNYWKYFDFTDTSYIHLPEVTEQAFADYVHMLTQLNSDQTTLSIHTTLSQAEVNPRMYTYFTDLFEKYLYDPNSPTRNEPLYLTVLETIIASDKVSDTDKIRPRYRLKMALNNRPEWPATDFTYTLASGATGTLYGIEANYVILFISNPGCPACKETVEQILQAQQTGQMIRNKQLQVLSIYPDEDLKAWRNYLPQMPSNWINGYDAPLALKKQELYDLRAIPTLYLLDRNKKVILKDAPFGAIEEYLTQQSSQ